MSRRPQLQFPLLIGSAGGLLSPNPQGVGTGGTSGLPSGWDNFQNSAGTGAWTKVGQGVEAGIPYADVRYAGTVGAGSPDSHIYPSADTFPAVQGQVFTFLFWIKLIAGSLTNVTFSSPAVDEFQVAAYLTGTYPTLTIPSGVPLNHPACLAYSEFTIQNALTTVARCSFLNTYTASSAVDATFRLGWLGVFAGKLVK